MKYLTLAIFIFASFATNTFGNCMMVPNDDVQVNLSKATSPIYDPWNGIVKGCILHTEKGVLGYSTDSGLCEMGPEKNVKVILSHSCCDTGPNSGERACTIRAKSTPDDTTIHGNGITVSRKWYYRLPLVN